MQIDTAGQAADDLLILPTSPGDIMITAGKFRWHSIPCAQAPPE